MPKTPLLPHVCFAANPPELPVRGQDDSGVPSSVAQASVTRWDPRVSTLPASHRMARP